MSTHSHSKDPSHQYHQFPASFPPASRQLPASFPPASRQLPASFPPASRQLPASFPPASRQLPASFPPASRQLPASFQPASSQLPASILQRTNPPASSLCAILQQSTLSSSISQDDQSILIETSSCNLQFFSELITTQLRDFHMVSLPVVFTLLIFLTMQSYKFYLVLYRANSINIITHVIGLI